MALSAKAKKRLEVAMARRAEANEVIAAMLSPLLKLALTNKLLQLQTSQIQAQLPPKTLPIRSTSLWLRYVLLVS